MDNIISNLPEDSSLYIPKEHDGHEFISIDAAAFDGYLGHIAEQVSKDTDVHPVQYLMGMMSFFTTAVGRNPYYKVKKAGNHRLKEFFLNVGATSGGRKGTAANYGRDLFFKAFPLEFQLGKKLVMGIQSGQVIIDTTRDLTDEEKAGDDEKNIEPRTERKEITIVAEEMSSYFKACNQPNSIQSGVTREAWDNEGNIAATSIMRGEVIAKNTHISIYGMTNVPDLMKDLNEGEYYNGFLNRFLIFWGHVTHHDDEHWEDDPKADTAQLDEFVANIKFLVNRGRGTWECKFDESAKKLWKKHSKDLMKELPGIGAILSRRHVHVMRLAMIYALTDMQHPGNVKVGVNNLSSSGYDDRNTVYWISDKHLKSALALMAYCCKSVYKIFATKTGVNFDNKNANKLIRHLRQIAPEGYTKKQVIEDVFQGNVKAEDIEEAYELLHLHSLVKEIKTPRADGKGAPRTTWYAVEHKYDGPQVS